MKLLILGDVMGSSGRNVLKNKLPKVIGENKIDFVIVNGENAADDGRGITQEIAEDFFAKGVDVITSGNHIWDKQETTSYIDKENRLLRPANLVEGSPGKGYEIYLSKNNEVGIFISKKFQGEDFATEALKLIMNKNPRPRYLANVNPKNLRSAKFFKKNKFKLIQHTYELEKI